MNLTRRIDLVGYLHIGYGALLLLISGLMLLAVTVGAIVLPSLATWVASTGGGITAALLLAALGLPSMVAGISLIRRASWARLLLIIISIIDLFSFPFGTALGAYSLYILLKERTRLEFA